MLFGRARYFLIYDTEKDEFKSLDKRGAGQDSHDQEGTR
ncbi:MAG: hypothetical protein KAV42_06175 [Candidatus Krumholzibacteria bacterium]|nr:hypothetical protein [Candidatus Krumholzibacteria bacterium]